MSTILGIDTASGDEFAVGVATDSETRVTGGSASFDHSKSLLSAIEAILDDDKGHLDAIAVTRGPGSYAGLRVGIATAYGLGIALGVPVLGVGTLEAAAVISNVVPVAAVHPAGRGEYAVQEFARVQPAGAVEPGFTAYHRPVPTSEVRIVVPGEMPRLPLAGEGAGALGGQEIAARARCSAVLAVAREMLETNQGSPVEPFYLREPQITAPRRSRMSGAKRAS